MDTAVEAIPLDEVRTFIEYVNRTANGEIIKHRVKRGKPKRAVGMVVGFVNSLNVPHVGWSLCSHLDKYDDERAYYIALFRAAPVAQYVFSVNRIVYPDSLHLVIGEVIRRITDRAINNVFENMKRFKKVPLIRVVVEAKSGLGDSLQADWKEGARGLLSIEYGSEYREYSRKSNHDPLHSNLMHIYKLLNDR